jgi:hypothetical protein
LQAPDLNPRGIVEDTVNGFLAGPTYGFAGTINSPGQPTQGYAAFDAVGDSVRASYPAVLPGSGADVLRLLSNSTFGGQAAYYVELAAASLGTTDDRYSQYEAELVNVQGTVLGSFRILSHNASELWLSPESGVLPATAAKLQIRAKFFQLMVGGAEGFGRTYRGSSVMPVSNVRVGFAFSSDPTDPTRRFPVNPNAFVFNLTDPTVQETIRGMHMPYLQWDVVFDTAYPSTAGELPVSSPDLTAPKLELHFLRIPFRF